MSWGTPDIRRDWHEVTCAFCGKRAPSDAVLMIRVGWQVRADYPVRYRCPRCRRRQEHEAA